MKTPESITAPNADKESLAESIRDFIKRCPYIDEYNAYINLNYLSDNTDSFSIESIAANPVIKRYITGDAIKEYQFYFASRDEFSMDVLQNIKSSQFYENLAEWLEECTQQRVLPDLSGNRKCLSIEARTQGFLASAQNGSAQYMIQCAMRYLEYKEKE